MHMFVTKQEIFEKGESNYFFQKVRHLQQLKIYTIVMEAGFQNLKSELRSFRVKRKPHFPTIFQNLQGEIIFQNFELLFSC